MGNLIGEPFLKYVNEQIELRQSVYGSGLLQQERSPEYIAYLNARTSWVKLASSVIINPEFTQQEVDQGLAQTRYNVATGAQGKKYNSGVGKTKRYWVYSRTSKRICRKCPSKKSCFI